MEKINFTEVVQIYCTYFSLHVTDLMSINTKTFSNGFLKRSTSNVDLNKDSYNFLISKI